MTGTETATETGAPPAFTPDDTALAHLELLLGGVYPFPGFLGREENEAVRSSGRLPDGRAWPVPVALTVPGELAGSAELILTDAEGAPLARLSVDERWEQAGRAALAGPVVPVHRPVHGVFRHLRRTPEEEGGSARSAPQPPLLAVVTDRPLHHRALTQIRGAAATLGLDAAGPDTAAEVLVLVNAPFHQEWTVRAVLAAQPYLPAESRVRVLTLPESDPVTGRPLPQERVDALAAHVAAAYGADQVMIESAGEAAAPHRSPGGTPIPVVAPGAWRYDGKAAVWRPAGEVAPESALAEPEDEQVDALLSAGDPLPAWFTPPEVADELAARRPPRSRRGLTLFFTGLSGSGKSTVARGVAERIREAGRPVSLLDGDVVRRMLSAGLTFSKEDRDRNIRRIGYVAAEISRHGGLAICAPIAPYAATRAEVRSMVEEAGGDFLLVHVATPLEVCEARDRKGLYAQARAGAIPAFTGVSDPYEEPRDPELVLDTSDLSTAEAVERVMVRLRQGGWMAG